jgi:hypothetical protein
MTRTRPLPQGVVAPPPLWALSAEHNAQRMLELARERRAREAAAALVTKHPVYYDGDPVTASARSLQRLAESKGMSVRMHVGLDGCTLEGRVPGQRHGFTATWLRGRLAGALWYEPIDRWGEVHDERPDPDATVARTVKGRTQQVPDPKRMPRGLPRHHLAYLGGAAGVVVSSAELNARVKALG